MIWRPAALLASIALLASGCTSFAAIEQAPKPCVEVFSQARCLAMIDQAAAEVSKTRADVAAVAIVPDPPPEGVTLGGAWHILVRVAFADGTSHDARMCGGLPSGPACMDDPRLSAASITAGGYRDVPCAGEPPDGCPTPFPSFEPEALEAAKPLTVAEVTIPIGHVGPYEVSLGKGSLPNGVLTEASFAFAVPWPSDIALTNGEAFIQVRSLEPGGKPFENYYTHGWHPGIERVEAFLIFNVVWTGPGAELGIRDVVVR